MNIVIVHLGTLPEILASTSIIKVLNKKFNNPNITFILKEDKAKDIFAFNKKIKTFFIHDLPDDILRGRIFDLLINLHPSYYSDTLIKFNEAIGFNYSPNSDYLYNIMYGENKSNNNLFQIYYSLLGLKWNGEGYDFCYFPKSRSKKERIGIAVSSAFLRTYVKKSLRKDLWVIPFKQNLLKQADEVNKCGTIITDNLLICNLAIALRKHVYFLKIIPMNYNIEFFGNGQYFEVPIELLQK